MGQWFLQEFFHRRKPNVVAPSHLLLCFDPFYRGGDEQHLEGAVGEKDAETAGAFQTYVTESIQTVARKIENVGGAQEEMSGIACINYGARWPDGHIGGDLPCIRSARIWPR